MDTDENIVLKYRSWIKGKKFPCIGAKASLARGQVRCMVASHMGCPAEDRRILQFLYDFVDQYRLSEKPFHSAAIIFRQPVVIDETLFDDLFWKRLKSLAALDREKHGYDKRVDADPASPNFSFSLREEAFFIIGIHPASPRRSRTFAYPAIVFNPHAEFEKLRKTMRYESMKKIVRKRDIAFSGSINPTLKDFGEASEVFQYSGTYHSPHWRCPLSDDHAKNDYNPGA